MGWEAHATLDIQRRRPRIRVLLAVEISASRDELAIHDAGHEGASRAGEVADDAPEVLRRVVHQDLIGGGVVHELAADGDDLVVIDQR